MGEWTVTRYDTDSGLYLEWEAPDSDVMVISQDGERELGRFNPAGLYGITIATRSGAEMAISAAIRDERKLYGGPNGAGLWDVD